MAHTSRQKIRIRCRGGIYIRVIARAIEVEVNKTINNGSLNFRIPNNKATSINIDYCS